MKLKHAFLMVAVASTISLSSIQDSHAGGRQGFTVGGQVGSSGLIVYGGLIGYRMSSVDLLADGLFGSGTVVVGATTYAYSSSLFRLNAEFKLGGGDLFVGPTAGFGTVSILGVSAFVPLIGGTVGYNIWLGDMFSITPVFRLSFVGAAGIGYDIGLRVAATF